MAVRIAATIGVNPDAELGGSESDREAFKAVLSHWPSDRVNCSYSLKDMAPESVKWIHQNCEDAPRRKHIPQLERLHQARDLLREASEELLGTNELKSVLNSINHSEYGGFPCRYIKSDADWELCISLGTQA